MAHVAAQAANGTSTQTHRYQFEYQPAQPGLGYYRLRQLDLDGTAHFSPVVAVRTGAAAVEVFPSVFDQSLTLGIADRKAPADTLLAEAQAWAKELSAASATAMALTKTILNQSFELSSHDIFAQGSQAQGICYTSSEHRASVEAFLAKTAAKE